MSVSTSSGTPNTCKARANAAQTARPVARFDLKCGMGPMPYSRLLESIRLYGTEVVPRVKELLGPEE
ncbi:hypothetical protein [Streptomyces sp. NPDC005969]|uniref:hypothetical protein n=1 Tax=Streptomyces sp. NPDC005969 TaxID=3156722 RepID=UPI0033F08BB7